MEHLWLPIASDLLSKPDMRQSFLTEFYPLVPVTFPQDGLCGSTGKGAGHHAQLYYMKLCFGADMATLQAKLGMMPEALIFPKSQIQQCATIVKCCGQSSWDSKSCFVIHVDFETVIINEGQICKADRYLANVGVLPVAIPIEVLCIAEGDPNQRILSEELVLLPGLRSSSHWCMPRVEESLCNHQRVKKCCQNAQKMGGALNVADPGMGQHGNSGVGTYITLVECQMESHVRGLG
ncbi:hypothetical protein EDD16DRAFT_1520182 [Pisolithus croceorrhizus]|nr:hypothetical protein EV401DRAFT_1893454 [Pisolithus croceorrhizus]KAI6117142.1 hypothetical protein EDD16DRAFT_1520182 [Pisolithus croceorrhizus]KAI6158466.1 hypothetical protein EDD17DRAFT_1512199 [Pisolithus thermaeus]